MLSKHKLKNWVREAYARTLFHTGLHALVNRMMPARLTILAGHCVSTRQGYAGHDFLAPDMKIREDRLEHIMGWLGSRYQLCTVAQGCEQLEAQPKQSLVALSMDDGYRDNHGVLLPLMQRVGAPATIYLIADLCEANRLDWSHMYFWILERIDGEEFLERYEKHSGDRDGLAKVRQVLKETGDEDDVTYHFKRYLKYEAEASVRDQALGQIFAELDGDQAQVARELLMDWDEARELQEQGFELGCHTRSHPVLERLNREQTESEICGSRDRLREQLGERGAVTFAYPFGRRWDYKDDTREVLRQAGFSAAVNTHSGSNLPGEDKTQMRRIMIDDNAKLHLIAAEACGGFQLLSKLGLNLSE